MVCCCVVDAQARAIVQSTCWQAERHPERGVASACVGAECVSVCKLRSVCDECP